MVVPLGKARGGGGGWLANGLSARGGGGVSCLVACFFRSLPRVVYNVCFFLGVMGAALGAASDAHP